MFRISLTTLCLIFGAYFASAQENGGGPGNPLRVTVLSADGGAVAGARIAVRGTSLTAVTDARGSAGITGVPDGEQVIEVSAEGFQIREVALNFPLPGDASIEVTLEPNEFGEVTVSTTRTGREIENTPTRVEAIDEEEIDEKSSMRSSNVSMILNESTGIKVQQTSATTFTQSIRIQGLDGRYTQILKDGFPAFGGFSGSLSILDIVPLDLRQVEIVKGAASTFYGGGAIAGVVNFVSREPAAEPSTSLILNQTSALGTDVSAFHTRRGERLGTTVLGTFNYQREYDADGDGFTELPLTRTFNLAPRLFVYGERSRLMVGNSTTVQTRKGGDRRAIRNDAAGAFFESNRSVRNITTAQFDLGFTDGSKLFIKQSVGWFGREIETPGYRFGGNQLNSYTEASYFRTAGRHALVVGAGAAYDGFREDLSRTPRLDETRTGLGAFVQDTVELSGRISLEAGVRFDSVRHYGVFALPRASLLIRLASDLTARLTYGLGYKTPSVFTEEAETLLFRNVFPIGNGLDAETSRGGTFDLNYRRSFADKATLSLNHMFFLTDITSALVLDQMPDGSLRFSNSDGRVRTAGFETNLRASYGLARLFAGYTFTIAKADHLPGDRILPLTPRSKLNAALLIEKENDFKAGIEAYFTGRQTLGNRSASRAYWVLGIFGEKSFGSISLFVNAENVTDTRQSRFGKVVFPPFASPTFAEIYTHTEGRIFNGGIKVRF